MIATPAGQKDVARLAVGELVETLDNGSVPIAWLGRRVVDLTARAHDKPILIQPGFFGARQPATDLIVSPDHRVLLRDPSCEFLFATKEALAPAKALVGLPRIREMRGKKKIEYIALFTERHAVVRANGLAVETVYPGRQTLRRVGALGRAQLFSACPALRHADAAIAYPAARRLLSVREAQAVADAMRLRRQVNREDRVSGSTPRLRLVN